MKITEAWLKEHAVYSGMGHTWTRAQIESLGIAYPPKRGWVGRLCGVEISDDMANRFIESKNVLTKYTLKRHRKEARRARERLEQPGPEKPPTLHPELDSDLPPPWC